MFIPDSADHAEESTFLVIGHANRAISFSIPKALGEGFAGLRLGRLWSHWVYTCHCGASKACSGHPLQHAFVPDD